MFVFEVTSLISLNILQEISVRSIDIFFLQDLMIDYVVVPVASGYGLTSEYQYLKDSIKEYLTGISLCPVVM